MIKGQDLRDRFTDVARGYPAKWANENKDVIKTTYIEGLDFDDIPHDYIKDLYELRK